MCPENINNKTNFMNLKIKLLAIMFVFALQSIAMWSATTSLCPVTLQCQQKPLLGNSHRPTKVPANYSIPLTVYYDEDSKQLLVTSFVEGEYPYFIYNDSKDLISQDILYTNGNNNYCIKLDSCDKGSYNFVVVYNGCVFMGTFVICE